MGVLQELIAKGNIGNIGLVPEVKQEELDICTEAIDFINHPEIAYMLTLSTEILKNFSLISHPNFSNPLANEEQNIIVTEVGALNKHNQRILVRTQSALTQDEIALCKEYAKEIPLETEEGEISVFTSGNGNETAFYVITQEALTFSIEVLPE